MKTRTEVKKHGNEWTFKVKDHNGSLLYVFNCTARTKKDAVTQFEYYKAQHNTKIRK